MANQSATLAEFASARSGDKGNHANLGIVARGEAEYNHLMTHLTADVVASHFLGLGVEEVRRYELPNLLAMNFVLKNALAGGASQSLRLDSQGKLLGTLALQIELPPLTVDTRRIK